MSDDPYPYGRTRLTARVSPLPRQESVQAKAERLAREGKVFAFHHPVRLFNVAGDTGTYKVTIGPGIRYCPCKANSTDCSHIQAAILYAKLHGEELLAYEMGISSDPN